MNEEIYKYALNHTWGDVANHFNMSRDAVRSRARGYASKHGLTDKLNSKRAEMATWTTQLTVDKMGNESSKDVISGSDWAEIKNKSEADLLRFAGYDPEVFELSKSYFNQYGGQTSVRVEVKKKNFGLDVKQLVDSLQDVKNINVYRPSFKSTVDAVINLPDMHFGFENAAFYDDLLERLSVRLHNQDVNELVVILGGDLLQAENAVGQTTSGTTTSPVDVQQMTTDMTRWLIKLDSLLASSVMKYKIVHVNGNHALNLENGVLSALNASGVLSIEQSGDWFSYGLNGAPIVAYHGGGVNKNKVKENAYLPFLLKKFPEIVKMQIETGNAIQVFTGHIHSVKLSDESGIQINRTPAVSRRSDWEEANGMVGQDNKIKIFYYEKGEATGVWNI